MKRSKFSDQQIAFLLRQGEEGASVEKVCHSRDALAALVALFDNAQLLFGSPPAMARRSGDDHDALVIIRHKPVLEDIFKPPKLCQVLRSS